MSDPTDISPFDPTKLSSDQQDVAVMIGKKALDAGLNPDLFIPWAFHESSLNPNAKGPEIQKGMHKGDRAGGLFQFMTKTASDEKLNDRFDPEKNADATISLINKYRNNPNIGDDTKKVLAAWVAGPSSKFVKTGNLDDLNEEESDYLIGMLKRLGTEDFPPLVHPDLVTQDAAKDTELKKEASTDEPPAPSMMPAPFENLTTAEATNAAGMGGFGAGTTAIGAETARGGKTLFDLQMEKLTGRPASLSSDSMERYFRGNLAQEYNRKLTLEEAQKLTGLRGANPTEIQDIHKEIAGKTPIYPENIQTAKGYGANVRYEMSPVTDGQYLLNGVNTPATPTGYKPKIDLSSYEYRPGKLGVAQKSIDRYAIPVVKTAGNVASSTAMGALSMVQAEDAIKRLQSGDKFGTGISATGSIGSGLSALGPSVFRSPKMTGYGLGLSGLSMGTNLARDFYKATPEEREAMMKKLKGLPSALFSPTEQSSAPSQEPSISDSWADFRRRYTPPAKRAQ